MPHTVLKQPVRSPVLYLPSAEHKSKDVSVPSKWKSPGVWDSASSVVSELKKVPKASQQQERGSLEHPHAKMQVPPPARLDDFDDFADKLESAIADGYLGRAIDEMHEAAQGSDSNENVVFMPVIAHTEAVSDAQMGAEASPVEAAKNLNVELMSTDPDQTEDSEVEEAKNNAATIPAEASKTSDVQVNKDADTQTQPVLNKDAHTQTEAMQDLIDESVNVELFPRGLRDPEILCESGTFGIPDAHTKNQAVPDAIDDGDRVELTPRESPEPETLHEPNTPAIEDMNVQSELPKNFKENKKASLTKAWECFLEELKKSIKTHANASKAKAMLWIQDPHVQVVSVCTAAGAMMSGIAGAICGLITGIVVGGAVGAVPALLTFGLSIPIGAVLGGAICLCIGALFGGFLGACGGGLAGHLVYQYSKLFGHNAEGTQISIRDVISDQIKRFATDKEKAEKIFEQRLAQVSNLPAKARALACHPHFHSVCAGALAMGILGGSSGLVAGVVLGAAAGMVPAIVTLGFSIPVGLVLGGLAGASLGSIASALLGSIAGHFIYKHRSQIKELAKFHSMAVGSVQNFPIRIMQEVSSCAKNRKGYSRMVCISASVGAIPLGAVGGVVGLVMGLLVGVAVGVLLAVFTFGLSIPVCAALGSAAGMCLGTIVGGMLGAAATGSAGHFSYTHGEQIKAGLDESRRVVVNIAEGMLIQTMTKLKSTQTIFISSCKRRASACMDSKGQGG